MEKYIYNEQNGLWYERAGIDEDGKVRLIVGK